MSRRPSPPEATHRVGRDARNRNRRRPDLGAALRTLCLIVLAAQGLRVAFASPRLRVTQVRVHGTARLTAADCIREGGIVLGGNIFRVNLVRVSERLRGDAVIRQVSVTRELPDGLSIDIVDRVPAYQVACAGVHYDVDADDFVFRRAHRYLLGHPLLEIPAERPPQVGAQLREEYAAAAHACTELAKQQHLDLRHMRIDRSGELWLSLATAATGEVAPPSTEQTTEEPSTTALDASKLKVRVGRMNDLPEKFRDIRSAVRGLPTLTLSAAHLDVMCPGRPAYLKNEPGGRTP